MNPHKRRIALYFGSFNPLHLGHTTLARYALERLALDALWLVLSPLNPHKDAREQLPYSYRRSLIERSLSGYDNLSLCTIEASLPAPRYTVRSLRALNMLYPDCEFSLLIGADTLLSLPSWYQAERILSSTPLYVYPRPGYEIQRENYQEYAKVHLISEVPECELSSSDIRRAISESNVLSNALPLSQEWEELSRQFSTLATKHRR